MRVQKCGNNAEQVPLWEVPGWLGLCGYSPCRMTADLLGSVSAGAGREPGVPSRTWSQSLGEQRRGFQSSGG